MKHIRMVPEQKNWNGQLNHAVQIKSKTAILLLPDRGLCVGIHVVQICCIGIAGYSSVFVGSLSWYSITLARFTGTQTPMARVLSYSILFAMTFA